jgi:hypothetical protein
MAIDATHAYFTDHAVHNVQRLALDGETAPEVVDLTHSLFPSSITIDGAHLVWSGIYADSNTPATPGVIRMPRAGGANPELLFKQAPLAPGEVLVTGPMVYAASSALWFFARPEGDGDLWGAATTTLPAGILAPGVFVSDLANTTAGDVFMVDGRPGGALRLWSSSFDAPANVVEGLDRPKALELRGQQLFWTELRWPAGARRREHPRVQPRRQRSQHELGDVQPGAPHAGERPHHARRARVGRR